MADELLRLKLKVWTSKTGRTYLCPTGFLVTRYEGPMVKAYIMRDDDTQFIEMTEKEWNSLPFYYFKEDGQVSDTERPVRGPDIVTTNRVD
jgi:hypothetical protein